MPPPKKALFVPDVFNAPAPEPNNEFPSPDVLALPAPQPKNELPPPELTCPAPRPRNRLFVPALLRMRLLLRLNCVVAFKMFAVPVPLMLKFDVDCWLVAF